ncbi:MAG: hypothetical protein AAFY31_11880, partial [Pseudomonadota bacterium]
MTQNREPVSMADTSAEKLAAELEKLSRPLRIVVYGVDCTATANVVNLLVAERILPAEGGRNADIRLSFARHYAVHVNAMDGDATRYDIEDLPNLMEAKQSLAIGAPLEVLRKIVLLRHAAEDHELLEAAAARSARFTDLTFLCSDTFGDQEKSFWSGLPEKVREKGYHILPLDARLPRQVQGLVSGIIRVDAAEALLARETPNGLDRDAFIQSGGMDLISTIRQELKWHERGIEEAKVALTHGGFSIRHTEPDQPHADSSPVDVGMLQVIPPEAAPENSPSEVTEHAADMPLEPEVDDTQQPEFA